MSDCNPANTPMDPKKHYSPYRDKPPDYPYSTMIGSLMWAALCMRPDISFAVHHLAQFNSCFGPDHIAAVKRIFRYLKRTPDRGITYSKSKSGTTTVGFTDADFAEGYDRKSITGTVYVMSGGAIAWSSKKQGTIALSTLEAEYTAISHATRHILWHKMLICELKLDSSAPFQLYNDNRGAIALSHDPQFHGQSKHINIRHHFICDYIERNYISIHHIPSSENLVDLFTKPLPELVFTKLVIQLWRTPWLDGECWYIWEQAMLERRLGHNRCLGATHA